MVVCDGLWLVAVAPHVCTNSVNSQLFRLVESCQRVVIDNDQYLHPRITRLIFNTAYWNRVCFLPQTAQKFSALKILNKEPHSATRFAPGD